MGPRPVDVAAILLNLVYYAYSDHILSCNVNALYPCPGDNQICNEQTQQCVCKAGFVLEGQACEAAGAPAAGHTAAVVVVTLFTLALLIGGLVLVFRKYDLLNVIRQKINLRRNNDVMYEDVMIGQDDPPLSP